MKLKLLILKIAFKIRSPILLKFLKKAGFFQIPKIRWIFNPNVLRRNFNYKKSRALVSLKGFSGEILEVDINDLIGYNLFVNKEMDPEILATCISFYNSDKDIFMDIGANIGSTSIGPCLATNSRLICIEASKKNSSLLNKNIYKNKIKAWSLNCAVTSKKKSDKNRFLDLYLSPGNFGSSSLNSKHSKNYASTPNEIEHVPLTTIDKCINFCNIDPSLIYLVKIDIEGEELHALKGAKTIFGKVPLLIEYNTRLNKIALLLDYLSKAYIFYTFDSKLNLCEFDPALTYSSLLCIPILERENYLKLYKKRNSLRAKLLLSLPKYGLKRLDKKIQ
tara:strand:+ start:525 stop:1526 length:1002 start_codon:yes stop_codon:yes gene_type:complete